MELESVRKASLVEKGEWAIQPKGKESQPNRANLLFYMNQETWLTTEGGMQTTGEAAWKG